MCFLFLSFISAALGYQTCVTLTNINSTVELFNDLEETMNICHETTDCIPSKSSVYTFFDPAEEQFASVSITESCILPSPSTEPTTNPPVTTQPKTGIYIDWPTAGVAAGLVLAVLAALKMARIIPGYITQVPDIRYRRARRTTTNESDLI